MLTHDGRQPIAIGHLSDSGDLNILGKHTCVCLFVLTRPYNIENTNCSSTTVLWLFRRLYMKLKIFNVFGFKTRFRLLFSFLAKISLWKNKNIYWKKQNFNVFCSFYSFLNIRFFQRSMSIFISKVDRKYISTTYLIYFEQSLELAYRTDKLVFSPFFRCLIH